MECEVCSVETVKVWSVKCAVCSVERGMWSVKCGVGSVELTVECGGLECEVKLGSALCKLCGTTK